MTLEQRLTTSPQSVEELGELLDVIATLDTQLEEAGEEIVHNDGVKHFRSACSGYDVVDRLDRRCSVPFIVAERKLQIRSSKRHGRRSFGPIDFGNWQMKCRRH